MGANFKMQNIKKTSHHWNLTEYHHELKRPITGELSQLPTWLLYSFEKLYKNFTENFLVNYFFSHTTPVNKCTFVSKKTVLKKSLKFKFPAQGQRILGWRGLFGAGSTPSHFVRFPTSRASHYVDRYCIENL